METQLKNLLKNSLTLCGATIDISTFKLLEK